MPQVSLVVIHATNLRLQNRQDWCYMLPAPSLFPEREGRANKSWRLACHLTHKYTYFHFLSKFRLWEDEEECELEVGLGYTASSGRAMKN